jgi:hypothetical protein
MKRELTRQERANIYAEVKEADRVIRLERNRKWLAENREKANAISRRWRAEHREDHRLLTRMWRYFNPEKAREANKSWREKNPDYHREWRARAVAAGHFRKGGKYYYPRKPKSALREGA